MNIYFIVLIKILVHYNKKLNANLNVPEKFLAPFLILNLK